MLKALIIKADGKIDWVEYTRDTEYETLKTAINGYIESVRIDDEITMWLNEEGKLHGLPFNKLATLLFQANVGMSDFIVGDVVLTGGIDAEGYTKSLDFSLLDI